MCLSSKLVVFPWIVLGITAGSVWGQSSSGTFGGRNLGGTVSAGQGSFSGGGGGGGAGGAGGVGAAPGNGVQAAQQGAGQVDGSERFLRDSRQPGQFVGADTADAQNFFSQGGMTGNQQNQFRTNNRNGANGNRNSNRQQGNNQFGGRNQSQQQKQMPLRLSAGLIRRPSPVTNIGESLNERVQSLSRPLSNIDSPIRRSPALTANSSVQVTVEGQTAVLRGTVSSDYERRLVSRMARLEPGIAAVRNELTIDPTASSSTPNVSPESLPGPN